MEYGACGDGKSDDSQVYTCFFLILNFNIYISLKSLSFIFEVTFFLKAI
jgi:hypothetical protein